MNLHTDLQYSSSEDQRVAFYKKTYMHVALAVLAFIIVEAFLLNVGKPIVGLMLGTGKGAWIAILIAFSFVTSYAQKLSLKLDKNTQYLGLGLFVLAEAFLFLPMIYMALSMQDGGNVIYQAGIMSVAVFSGLTAMSLFGNTDFSFLRSAITIGTFIAIGLILAGWIFGFNLGLWFSVGMAALASGSILYQTSQLKYSYGTEQYVGAAAALFGSLMLLFWYILRIFMSRD